MVNLSSKLIFPNVEVSEATVSFVEVKSILMHLVMSIMLFSMFM
jgi:hypothetical protein